MNTQVSIIQSTRWRIIFKLPTHINDWFKPNLEGSITQSMTSRRNAGTSTGVTTTQSTTSTPTFTPVKVSKKKKSHARLTRTSSNLTLV